MLNELTGDDASLQLGLDTTLVETIDLADLLELAVEQSRQLGRKIGYLSMCGHGFAADGGRSASF